MRKIKIRRILTPILAVGALLGIAATACRATEVILRDGRSLHGKLGEVTSLAEAPTPGQSKDNNASITFLDDELRRTFFAARLVQKVDREDVQPALEKFSLRQRVVHGDPAQRGAPMITSIGQPLKVEPFDEHGRRTFSILTAKGVVPVIQGITVLTPQWAKVEGMRYIWDMRIATSSIPPEILHKILLTQIDADNKDLEDRQKIDRYTKVARFYLQCERYDDARKILEELPKLCPKQPGLQAQLNPVLLDITQESAKNRVRELRLRQNAGQHQLVYRGLEKFPTEGVGGDILQAVREMIQKYDTNEDACKDVAKQLRALTARIPALIAKENLKPILDEIADEIGPNTIDRMAAFRQNAKDPETPDADKVALAVSGWLMGADAGTPKLPLAISAYKVRGLIRDYLNQTTVPEREQSFGYIQTEPAGDPAMVAKLLSQMKPPFRSPDPLPGKPGYYQLEVPGLEKEAPITYYVQLPPEYNPYRFYPAIVTLNGEVTTAEQQIEWWAGPWVKGRRLGQATRQGYIVIAPVWTVEHQRHYECSVREHTAVLNSLRDACRRFAIDTDRVFLSGHSMGGSAAWDIALAHPDLWAGVIPVVGQCDRYCTRYWENARYLPFYVISGEKDGGVRNTTDLDRYLGHGYNATVVEFRGRGHEDFYEEILRIFEWMGHFHRDFFPKEFDCRTMRPWDSFFWYVDVDGLPPKATVQPANWPPPRGTVPARVKGTISAKNGVLITTGANQATVWLSPKMVDFKQRISVSVNGRTIGPRDIRPDVHVLLEDVRTRGDRQHPFWARVP